MKTKQLYLITVTAILLLSACANAPEQVAEPEANVQPKQQPQSQPSHDKSAPSPSDPTADGWIDYTPKYLWAYSSQFHEGFQNIRDTEQIAQAVTIINAAPLVTEADKQPNWGLLQFATGEMQIHFSKAEQKVYLLFGGQIKATDDELLKVLGIEELKGR